LDSLDALGRVFASGFGRVLDAPMYGYEVFEPRFRVAVNVSDAFVAAYERDARHVDPVLAQALDTRRPAYSGALMSAQEWEASTVYRRAYRMHCIRHVVEAPVLGSGRVLGCLHVAATDAARTFSAEEVALAEAIAGVLAAAIERVDARRRLEHERDDLLAAFDLMRAPVVTSGAAGIQVNAPARRVLDAVVDAELCLHRLLARPAGDGAFSRRVDVELVSDEAGVLEATSTPARGDGLVTVLGLVREAPDIAPGALAVLTPREAEVALLVADGLPDRAIADRLHLSHHTVGQHVKRIYRRLDVDSRVALTRLLLGAA
jgi:DNA-binding CsgD family transcriptional regulator/GAF domain-containing protein